MLENQNENEEPNIFNEQHAEDSDNPTDIAVNVSNNKAQDSTENQGELLYSERY